MKLQNRIFEKLFEVAEIAKFSPKERKGYQASLKYYLDLTNVVKTSKEEGREEGRDERNVEIARKMRKKGEPIEKIMDYTGLGNL